MESIEVEKGKNESGEDNLIQGKKRIMYGCNCQRNNKLDFFIEISTFVEKSSKFYHVIVKIIIQN